MVSGDTEVKVQVQTCSRVASSSLQRKGVAASQPSYSSKRGTCIAAIGQYPNLFLEEHRCRGVSMILCIPHGRTCREIFSFFSQDVKLATRRHVITCTFSSASPEKLILLTLCCMGSTSRRTTFVNLRPMDRSPFEAGTIVCCPWYKY